MTTKIIKAISLILAAVSLSACAEEKKSEVNIPGDIKVIEAADGFKGNTEDVKLEKGDTYAVIKIKDYGEIKCKLFPQAAPEGVKHFIETAESGFYTNKIIHRVVKNFMLQGGSANGDGMSSEDEPKFNVEYNKYMRHYYGALCYANAGGINGTQFYIVNNKGCDLTKKEDIDASIAQIDDYITQVQALIEATTGDEKTYYQYQLEQFKAQKKTLQSSLKAIEDRSAAMEEKYKEVGGYPYLDGGYTVFGQTVEGFDVIDKISQVEVEKQSSGSKVSHPVVDIVIESVTIGTVE